MPPKKRPAEAPSPVSGLSMGIGAILFTSQGSSQGSVVIGSQGSILRGDCHMDSQDASQSQQYSQPEYFSGDFCTPEDQVAELDWSQGQRDAENAEPNGVSDKICPPTPDSAAKRRKTRSALGAAPAPPRARRSQFMYDLESLDEKDEAGENPKSRTDAQRVAGAGRKTPPAPPAKGRGPAVSAKNAKGKRSDPPAQTNTIMSWLSQEGACSAPAFEPEPSPPGKGPASCQPADSVSPSTRGALFTMPKDEPCRSGGTTKVGATACCKNPFLSSPLTERERKTPSRALPRLDKSARASRYLQDFEELAVLGAGNFGSVMLVRSRIDGQKYAVKRKESGRLDNAKHMTKQEERAMREVWAMAALGEVPHVVRYFSAWREHGQLFIQMEACECHLKARYLGKQPSAAVLLRILEQMGAALAGMHELGLAHLDVKPDNIYCTGAGFRLGDFGLVCSQQMVLDGVEPEEGDGRYASPQVIQGFSQLDVKELAPCDVYALGATVLELAYGRALSHRDADYARVRDGAAVELKDQSVHGLALARILTDMLQPNADLRIDCATVVRLARNALDGGEGESNREGGGRGSWEKTAEEKGCVEEEVGDVEMGGVGEQGGSMRGEGVGQEKARLEEQIRQLKEELAVEQKRVSFLEQRHVEGVRFCESLNASCSSQRSDAEPIGSQESPLRILAQPMPSDSPNPNAFRMQRRSPRAISSIAEGFKGQSPAASGKALHQPSPAPKGSSMSPFAAPPPRPPRGGVAVTRCNTR